MKEAKYIIDNSREYTINKINYVTKETINDITRPFIITDKKNVIKNKRRFHKIWKLK